MKKTIHIIKKLEWCSNEYYIGLDKEVNDKNPKFQVGNHVRISNKYKNIFTKEYTPNLSEEVFLISKIKNPVAWTYIISHLSMVDKLFGTRKIK